MGSFINVVAHRLPAGGLKSLSGRSKCPRCDRTIAWFDNIPVLAWILLRAKCRGCKLPISPRYPIVEAICGILFFTAWLAQFWSRGIPQFTPALIAQWCVLSSLLALSLIDLDLRILPDELTISGMLLGPPLAALLPELLSDTWSYQKLAQSTAISEPWLRSAMISLAGLAAGAGTIAMIRTLGTLWFSSKSDVTVAADAAGMKLEKFLCLQKPRRGKKEIHAWIEEGCVEVIRNGQHRKATLQDTALALAASDVVRIHHVREAMGFGDVKLQGAVGAVVGPEGTFLVLGIASFAGALIGTVNLLRIFLILTKRAASRRRTDRSRLWQVARIAGGTIPFGPFLAIGAAAVLLARAPIVKFLLELWKPV